MPGIRQFLNGQLLQTPPLPATPLPGRTIIVTGANTGLGLEACKHLARLDCATIIMGVRTVAKGEAVRESILAASTSKTARPAIEIWPLDLTSYASVAAFADRAAKLPRLDAAILNAGVSLTEFSVAEGLETTLTVNVTSTFLLGLLLLPTLHATTEAHPDVVPHIAIVGSAVHFWAEPKALTRIPESRSILTTLSDKTTAKMGADRYNLSKLLVMLCVRQLAAQITASCVDGKTMVIVNNVAPGYCATDLFRHDASVPIRASLKVIGRSAEQGARTLVHGATEAGLETHGMYLSECEVKKASAWVMSAEGEKVGRRVWGEVLGVAEGVREGVEALI